MQTPDRQKSGMRIHDEWSCSTISPAAPTQTQIQAHTLHRETRMCVCTHTIHYAYKYCIIHIINFSGVPKPNAFLHIRVCNSTLYDNLFFFSYQSNVVCLCVYSYNNMYCMYSIPNRRIYLYN
jgi:hypothetical protein